MCLSLLAAAGKKTDGAETAWDWWLPGERASDPKDTPNHLGTAVVMGKMGVRRPNSSEGQGSTLEEETPQSSRGKSCVTEEGS